MVNYYAQMLINAGRAEKKRKGSDDYFSPGEGRVYKPAERIMSAGEGKRARRSRKMRADSPTNIFPAGVEFCTAQTPPRLIHVERINNACEARPRRGLSVLLLLQKREQGEEEEDKENG